MLLLLLPPPPRSAGRGAGRRLGSGRCARPGGVRGDIYSQAPPPALPRAAGPPGGGGDECGRLPLPDPGPNRPRGCAEHREPRGRRGPPAPGVCASRSSGRAIPNALGVARPAWRAPRVCAAPGPGVPLPSPRSSRVRGDSSLGWENPRPPTRACPRHPSSPGLRSDPVSLPLMLAGPRQVDCGRLPCLCFPLACDLRDPLRPSLRDPKPHWPPLASSSPPPAPPRPRSRSPSLFGARPALPVASSCGSCSNWSGRGLKPPEAGGEEAYRADSPRLGAK